MCTYIKRTNALNNHFVVVKAIVLKVMMTTLLSANAQMDSLEICAMRLKLDVPILAVATARVILSTVFAFVTTATHWLIAPSHSASQTPRNPSAVTEAFAPKITIQMNMSAFVTKGTRAHIALTRTQISGCTVQTCAVETGNAINCHHQYSHAIVSLDGLGMIAPQKLLLKCVVEKIQRVRQNVRRMEIVSVVNVSVSQAILANTAKVKVNEIT